MLRYITGLVLASCGPSSGTEPDCTLEDVEGRGALVDDNQVECQSCPASTSFVWIAIETACSGAVELGSARPCLVRRTTATLLEGSEQYVLEDDGVCSLTEEEFRVTMDEPLEVAGPRLDTFIDAAGSYGFVVELELGLPDVHFDGVVE